MRNVFLLWYCAITAPPHRTPKQELARWRWQHGLRVGYSKEMSLAKFLSERATPEMIGRPTRGHPA